MPAPKKNKDLEKAHKAFNKGVGAVIVLHDKMGLLQDPLSSKFIKQFDKLEQAVANLHDTLIPDLVTEIEAAQREAAIAEAEE